MMAEVMKHLCIVLIVCWFSVIDGKAVGRVVPLNTRLQLQMNGTHIVLYRGRNVRNNLVQRKDAFPRNTATNYRIRVAGNSIDSIKAYRPTLDSSFSAMHTEISTANVPVLNISQLTTVEATTQPTTTQATTTPSLLLANA